MSLSKIMNVNLLKKSLFRKFAQVCNIYIYITYLERERVERERKEEKRIYKKRFFIYIYSIINGIIVLVVVYALMMIMSCRK